MPTVSRVGNRGSKYLTPDQIKAIGELAVKEAVILPTLDGVVPAYQRRAVTHYIGTSFTAEELGNKVFNVGVVPDKGIAVQRIEDKKAEEAKK